MSKQKASHLVSNLLNYYSEYVSNGYPKDPNIYFIRVSVKNKERLLKASNSVLFKPKNVDLSEGDRFMGFPILVDARLSDEEIVFGPETVTFSWSDNNELP